MGGLQNGNNSMTFNNFEQVPEMTTKIIEKLILDESETAQNFWKALVYTDIYCLNKENLTLNEKLGLFWQGKGQQEQFKIFNKPLIGNSLTDSSSMTHLRLYRVDNQPSTKNDTTLIFEFDIVTNETDNSLYNENGYFVEKTDYIEAKLLTLLNGLDLGIGYGYLRFDKETSRSCNSILSINNSLNFYGRRLFMAYKVSGFDKDGVC